MLSMVIFILGRPGGRGGVTVDWCVCGGGGGVCMN